MASGSEELLDDLELLVDGRARQPASGLGVAESGNMGLGHLDQREIGPQEGDKLREGFGQARRRRMPDLRRVRGHITLHVGPDTDGAGGFGAGVMLAPELGEDLGHMLAVTLLLGDPFQHIGHRLRPVPVDLAGGLPVLFTAGIPESGDPVTGV